MPVVVSVHMRCLFFERKYFGNDSGFYVIVCVRDAAMLQHSTCHWITVAHIRMRPTESVFGVFTELGTISFLR